MNIVFEGGGFPAFWYGLGYGMKFLENEKPTFLAGYSAGALVAALLLFQHRLGNRCRTLRKYAFRNILVVWQIL